MLEEELRAPLLERVAGGVVLTEAGRAFLPYAEAALASLQDGVDAVLATEREMGGVVSLALVGTLAATSIVDILREFARRHPTVHLQLRTANSQEVSELVRRGEVTLGLRYFTDESRELSSTAVGEENMVVVCSADHDLARRDHIEPDDVRGQKWVGFGVARTRRESFAHVLRRQLAAAGLDDAELILVDSLTAQKRLVEAGFGVALLPASSIQEELRLGTMRILDAPRLATKISVALIRRKHGHLSLAAQSLLSLVVTAGTARE